MAFKNSGNFWQDNVAKERAAKALQESRPQVPQPPVVPPPATPSSPDDEPIVVVDDEPEVVKENPTEANDARVAELEIEPDSVLHTLAKAVFDDYDPSWDRATLLSKLSDQ